LISNAATPFGQPRMESSQAAFQIFAFLSGAAGVFLTCEQYSGALMRGGVPPLRVLLPAVLAVVLMWIPSSITAFLAFWSALAVSLLSRFPQNNTNQTLLFLIGLSILTSAAVSGVRNGWIGLRAENQLTVFAPVVRLCIIGLYFWTVFHKLNKDFINPEVSCHSPWCRSPRHIWNTVATAVSAALLRRVNDGGRTGFVVGSAV